jgi:hypothetical protein
MDQLGPDEFKCLLKRAVPEYRPQLTQVAANVAIYEEVTEAKDRRNGKPRRPELVLEEPFGQIAGVNAAG